MWVCLLYALVFSTNSWADPTDVTWDGTSGHEHPSGTTGSPASDTKSGITVTTNWSTQSGLCVRTGCTNGKCYNFEYAPADNYIDITTDGKILQTVYVSITNTNNVANVTIAFSSASTYDGNNLAAIMKKISTGAKYEKISNKLYSEQLINLVYKMMDSRPNHRPKPDEILNMEFIQKIQKKQI